MEVQKVYRGGNEEQAAVRLLSTKPRQQEIRVAAYCRVSTDMEMQQTSLENQMAVFRQRINEHPGWKLSGIYADRGLSGTQIENRSEFLRMLQDCREGRINYIITKSISRFARNTVDCVETVRYLKAMGVHVYFEKENFDTGTAISEMMLTVLAAFAQEESRSISENLKWGLRKRFEVGVARWSQLYGYRHNEDGEWIIQEDEAEIVRWMFDSYEHGISSSQIGIILRARTDDAALRKKWHNNVIRTMLGNEKYMGDMQLQKFYTVDYLTHKRIRNDYTELPGYYVKNHHPGIVSRKTFERVQVIRKLKDGKKGMSLQYPYGPIQLLCPCCGKKLVRRIIRIGGQHLIWTCYGEGGCQQYAIREAFLNMAVLEARQLCGINVDQETVEYWWLDEYVKEIRPDREGNVTVLWKDGSMTTGKAKAIKPKDQPDYVIKAYRKYIESLESGEHIIYNPQTPEERAILKARKEREGTVDDCPQNSSTKAE